MNTQQLWSVAALSVLAFVIAGDFRSIFMGEVSLQGISLHVSLQVQS